MAVESNTSNGSLQSICYEHGSLRLLDQRRLPLETLYLDIRSATDGCFLDYQDTLYVYEDRQFYRERNIFGTIDFIFGMRLWCFRTVIYMLVNPLTINPMCSLHKWDDDLSTLYYDEYMNRGLGSSTT